MKTEDVGELLTVREVSQILSVSERSVREFIRTGELRASKVGQWRIPKSEVRSFFEKRSNMVEEMLQMEIDRFLAGDENQSHSPTTMVVRDYRCECQIDLSSVEEGIRDLDPDETGFKWRYVFDEASARARHVFFGDLSAARKIIGILDGLYLK